MQKFPFALTCLNTSQLRLGTHVESLSLGQVVTSFPKPLTRLCSTILRKPQAKKVGGPQLAILKGGRYVHIRLSQKSVLSFGFDGPRPTFLLRSNQAEAESISGAIVC